jgi:hypothetical protein
MGGGSGAQPQESPQGMEPATGDESPDEGASPESASHESASPAEDARDTRPEPFENAFGVAAHPAEPQPGAAEDGAPRSAEPRVAPDTPDADGQ